MKLPSEIFGINRKEAYEEVLSREKNQDDKVLKSEKTVIPVNIENPEGSVILEGRQHGDYSYPDLLVGMHKLRYNADIENVAKSLGLNLQNTGREKNGYQYIGEINHEQAMNLLLGLDNIPLNLRQFVDFINLLKSGKAFYANGNRTDKKILDSVLDEILTLRNPRRGEWFANRFNKKGNQFYTTYYILNNGKIEEINKPLEDCLMENRTPGIDLEHWLRNANNQGLPPKNIHSGSLYYWCLEENNTVAGFSAGSYRVGLDSSRVPRLSDSSLGVRPAREK